MTLEATTFAGTTNPTEAKKWLSLIEKCFGVMDCSEERKVKLVMFLSHDSIEDWWILHAVRVGGEDLVGWE